MFWCKQPLVCICLQHMFHMFWSRMNTTLAIILHNSLLWPSPNRPPATSLLIQQLVQASPEDNTQDQHTGPLWQESTSNQGANLIQRCFLSTIENPIVEIRRSCNHLVSIMGFPLLVRWHLFIESGPSGSSEKRCHWCVKCVHVMSSSWWPFFTEQDVCQTSQPPSSIIPSKTGCLAKAGNTHVSPGKQQIDQFHKSHSSPVPYPTMHHSEQKYTFLFWMVHCGIWNRCIVGFVN